MAAVHTRAHHPGKARTAPRRKAAEHVERNQQVAQHQRPHRIHREARPRLALPRRTPRHRTEPPPRRDPVTDVKRRLFDWTAEPARILVEDRFGTRPATAHLGVTASDNGDILGIDTDEYEIRQFSDWLLDNVSAILDDGLAIGSAGLLRERKKAWVSVEMPDNIITPEGVEFRPNLLACSSHDAGLKTRYKRVVTNVVCDNTMTAGLREDELGRKRTNAANKRSAPTRL
jgi:hypothetical protein